MKKTNRLHFSCLHFSTLGKVSGNLGAADFTVELQTASAYAFFCCGFVELILCTWHHDERVTSQHVHLLV